MPTPTVLPVPTENQLLAALPRAEYERLIPHLQRVQLRQGQVLFAAGDLVRHVYFPLGVVASLLSSTEEGEMVEVAMAGFEGMIGVPVILRVSVAPYTA